MQVLNALKSDKKDVIKFCKNTFSWGDYISEIWDYWYLEGNLFVVRENNSPVALSHASISKKDQQVWIEGIRVNPNFRRKGYASSLIQHSENQAIKNDCLSSFMLIETNNKNSLELSKKLGYVIKETWNFFSLLPEKSIASQIEFTKTNTKVFDLMRSLELFYVDSWRWYPLNDQQLSLLVENQQIIYYNDNDEYSVAVITSSKHFAKTMIVTLLFGNDLGIKKLLDYSKHLANLQNFKRIQVLTKLNKINDSQDIIKKLSFYLMWKKLE
ncbi:MAG: GNAT family N-acetyltransferase [Crenarchaeota archaeon]|nr:MAG: GNAT family N-acetyltransferase [Thermoproteota archaeon]RDJ33541.1 MAG: GNAT family N-acetyltransferase [Thermoproteota archaeon]RDJ38138.1 MAG: GNAT family N-acetyltransferase [Thermoproteota archaeon]RDJ39094.1 MAG: GNAT family N-acetyltransferase [Thermoproteota archaeon]